MRILYLGLEMGAAGDMLSAALYELLSEQQKREYQEKINNLGLDGVRVAAERSEKCGLAGTHMSVRIDGEEESPADAAKNDSPLTLMSEHSHRDGCSREGVHSQQEGHVHEHEHTDREGHMHHHAHSSLHHVNETILSMSLPDAVKKNALEVYDLLAGAESRAHGTDVEKIHFHEVGEKDAIVDVVSFCLLMDMLRPCRVIASPAATGSGTVRCAHGILPVPAPATAYILQSRKIPCYAGPETCELLTPTGAALIGHFVDEFGKMPAIIIEKTGYGMGKKDFGQANCVRAILGEPAGGQVPAESAADPDSIRRCVEPAGGQVPAESAADPDSIRRCVESAGCLAPKGAPGQVPAGSSEGGRDVVSELACNLDDMTPEDIAYACQQLFAAGALDVFTTAIGMKKNRPGVMLTALCHEDRKKAVVKAFFHYTTTLGVREKVCGRYIMKSEKRTVTLGGGEETREERIDVKISMGYGENRVKPEFDQIAEAARRSGTSTAEIRRNVLQKLK